MSAAPSDARPTVSVVIPVLNAARHLPDLLPRLLAQRPAPPEEIVLVDSGSRDGTVELARSFDRVRVVPIARFSHGRARNLGVREARGELVALMTQDAVPRDEQWLAALLAPLDDPGVAATYSRQVPRDDANPMERFFLATRFPPGPPVRRKRRPGRPPSLEDVFFSNVAAAVRRPVLLDHPFDESLIMSEDQQFARDALAAGFATVYVPDSVVVHSHNYSLGTCFRRYFDSVYSLTVIFPRHDMGTSASMGFSYLWREFRHMARRHPAWLPYYALYTCAKTAGTLAGHFAERMPRRVARRLSLHRYHWENGAPT
jgi:rhamnosyltransferase